MVAKDPMLKFDLNRWIPELEINCDSKNSDGLLSHAMHYKVEYLVLNRLEKNFDIWLRKERVFESRLS
jgi:hypothetical protein